MWERERYDVFRLGKLERADLLTHEFGRERIVAAIGVRIAWSQVWAICVWIELSAIAGVFDSGLRVYMVHKGGRQQGCTEHDVFGHWGSLAWVNEKHRGRQVRCCPACWSLALRANDADAKSLIAALKWSSHP